MSLLAPSREELGAARLLVERGFYAQAVSRVYYGVEPEAALSSVRCLTSVRHLLSPPVTARTSDDDATIER